MDMKKIITCAALLAGIVFFNGRLNAQVESDIVGYQTIEVTQTHTLLGINFTNIGDKSDALSAIDLNKVVSGDFMVGDQIQIPSGSGYTLAGWNGEKWVRMTAAGALTTRDPATVTPGRGVWLYTPNASETSKVNVHLVGAVKLGATTTIDCGTGFSIAASIAPAELDINTCTWSNMTLKDQIQIPSGSGYALAGWNGEKWVRMTAAGALTTREPPKVPMGSAFWLMTQSANASYTLTVSE